MGHGIISADCHMDLMFVPEDTFTARAPAGWRDHMPRIVESDDGFAWVAGERGELRLGTWASQGSRVWSGVRGRHMREAGYAPEERRPANPEKRLADLERDGVDAEVIYGIFQLQNHVSDGDLVAACFTAYNQFIAEFCQTHPSRFFGLGCLPGHTVEAGVLELERVARLGLPGAEWSYVDTSRPVWHPQWEPLWAAAAEHNIPLSFHVRTKGTTTTVAFEPEVNLVSTAAYNAVVQMQLDEALASVLMSGALERHPGLRVVLAESGVAGSPTCWSAPTTSGRTTSTSTGAPSRRRPASSSAARCTPPSRRTPWGRLWPRSGAPTASCGAPTTPTRTASGRTPTRPSAATWAASARRCAASWSGTTAPGSTA